MHITTIPTSYVRNIVHCYQLHTYMTMMQIFNVIGLSDKSDVGSIST